MWETGWNWAAQLVHPWGWWGGGTSSGGGSGFDRVGEHAGKGRQGNECEADRSFIISRTWKFLIISRKFNFLECIHSQTWALRISVLRLCAVITWGISTEWPTCSNPDFSVTSTEGSTRTSKPGCCRFSHYGLWQLFYFVFCRYDDIELTWHLKAWEPEATCGLTRVVALEFGPRAVNWSPSWSYQYWII